ncbi:hypothetical protein [Devosia sp. A16]|uniref:hypothetical protein n=1 Tax=Devosia sp. A16 TaxID=1736675 RepID=UPI000AA1CEFF|nr:hypothetical protein [Devosia sp. A16]
MSERKRSVLTRGETMFWESAYVIAVLVGVFASTTASQVKLNPLLVLLFGVAPWTVVWVARKLWRPPPVARDEDVDTRPDRYKSSDPLMDMMRQSEGPHISYIFAAAAALALVATFVYRGDFEDQDGLAQVSAMLGFFVGNQVVMAQWAMRRPLLYIPNRPLFGFLGLLVVLALGVTLYAFRDVFSSEGRVIAGALVGGGLGVSLATWLRNVRG